MTDRWIFKGSTPKRKLHVMGALLVSAGAGLVGGCLNRPIQPNEPRTTTTITEPFTQSAVDKIDLLLMIDNSASMADKQKVLAKAVPDLVNSLVNPKCVDVVTGSPDGIQQPNTPSDKCPTGAKREFPPVLDIHIGVISSSLGGHGAPTNQRACMVTTKSTYCEDQAGNPASNASNNDAGHLLHRRGIASDICAPNPSNFIPTYGASGNDKGKGFLAWDPKQQKKPMGEKALGDINGNAGEGLIPTLREMVLGVGQIGCGFEASLESWYRFLIDPDPYAKVTINKDGRAVPEGTDQTVLQQRKDFLRASSLLAIIMLSDENDCSVADTGYGYIALDKDEGTIWRGSAACANDPNDKCCYSCGNTSVPKGCTADPTCKEKPYVSYNEKDGFNDAYNVRCMDQKRRFGIDFLYPISRYVNGLTSATVKNRKGEDVDNPIFSKLNENDPDTNIRDPGLVFLAGIVGVPWQDIARDPKDLKKGFKNSEELAKSEKDTPSTWDVILGNPEENLKPKDPRMLESIDAREGLPKNKLQDAIHGNEYTVPADKRDDLQYACIFKLDDPVDCSKEPYSTTLPCDCRTGYPADSPLCEGPNQVYAKAYPGLRQLAVLKKLGTQGIVGSVCPAQLANPNSPDYGYRPAVGAIIDRLKSKLGGQCLPRSLTPDANGQVSCLIIEARKSGGQCACEKGNARLPVAEEHKRAIDSIKEYEAERLKPKKPEDRWDCFCEITQAGDPAYSNAEELKTCQNDTSLEDESQQSPVNGWCYIDATRGIGNPELVRNCAETEKRLVRFVGKGNPQSSGTLFITCTGESGGS